MLQSRMHPVFSWSQGGRVRGCPSEKDGGSKVKKDGPLDAFALQNRLARIARQRRAGGEKLSIYWSYITPPQISAL